jgi:hypothetical protein
VDDDWPHADGLHENDIQKDVPQGIYVFHDTPPKFDHRSGFSKLADPAKGFDQSVRLLNRFVQRIGSSFFLQDNYPPKESRSSRKSDRSVEGVLNDVVGILETDHFRTGFAEMSTSEGCIKSDTPPFLGYFGQQTHSLVLTRERHTECACYYDGTLKTKPTLKSIFWAEPERSKRQRT